MHSIQIKQIINQKDIKKIKHLIKEYPFKPYYFLKQLKNVDVDRLFEQQLSKHFLDKNNFVLAAKKGNSYVGFMMLEKQVWDSSFFGFNCYKIENLFVRGSDRDQFDIKKKLLESALCLCKRKKIRYLNVKVESQDNTSIFALESGGFNLVSTMLRLAYFTSQTRPHFKQIGKIRSYRTADLRFLRKIARNSMFYDQFHSDPHFSKATSDKVYVSLIENCCNGALADKIFVDEMKSKIVGYVACRIYHALNKILPIRIGYIRHLATLQPEGFGCGPGLQEYALNWFQNKVDIVESATTIQNLPIIKISIKSNMNIVSSYLRFSKWFEV